MEVRFTRIRPKTSKPDVKQPGAKEKLYSMPQPYYSFERPAQEEDDDGGQKHTEHTLVIDDPKNLSDCSMHDLSETRNE